MSEDYIKIIERIKLTSTESGAFLKREAEKFSNSIKEDLEKLIVYANSYRKTVEELKIKWEQVNEEVKKLEANRDTLKARADELDTKAKTLSDEETSLADLHKVLDNRKKVLDAREQEIQVKERRLREA